MRPRVTSLVVLVALMTVPAHAADPWSKGDKVREAAYQALLVVDWGQTRYIAKNPDRHYETNPVLGRHPSVRKVDAYFALSVLTHLGVSHVLPSKWRARYQYVTTAVEVGYVANNFCLGIRIDF